MTQEETFLTKPVLFPWHVSDTTLDLLHLQVQGQHLSYQGLFLEDDDPGYEQDPWRKRKKESELEEEEILRADCCYYKNMDGYRDNPAQSGHLQCLVYLNTQYTYHTYATYYTYYTYFGRVLDKHVELSHGATVYEKQTLFSYQG